MSYRLWANRPDDLTADAIIIGSGPAGLTVASTLGKFGKKKTLVLEAHPDRAGGTMHSFNLGDEHCSIGLHYTGTLTDTTAPIIDFVTAGQGFLHLPDDIYDTMHIKGTNQRVALTSANFEETLGIRKAEFDRVADHINFVVAAKLLWYPLARIVFFMFWITGRMAEAAMPYAQWCRKHYFKAAEPDAATQEVWWMEQGDHGAPRAETCATVGALTTSHYQNGQTHWEGGMVEMSRRMCRVAKENGATILVDAPVDKVVFDDKSGKVVGVTVRGVLCKAPIVVISGAHAAVQLLGDRCPAALKSTLSLGLSPQHGVVFLTYAGKTASSLGLTPGCQWMEDRYFLSHKDSETGCVVYVLWEMPYEPRGGDYLDKKQQAVDAAKEYVFAKYEKLRNYDKEESATPATTEHYLSSYKGCSWGLKHATKRITDFETVRALRFDTDIPGVYLTGQDTVFCGIPSAAITGVFTSQMILNPPSVLDFVTGNTLLDRIKAMYAERKKKGLTNGKQESSKTK